MAEPLAEQVFLVSGGARGVTAACAVALARAGARAFILLGRSPLDHALPFADHAPDAALKGKIAAHLKAGGEKVTPLAIQRLFNAVTARNEIAGTLQAMAAAGARAEYLSVDVSDRDALSAALAMTTLGPVTGIVHGAGVLSDRLIEDKTQDDFDRVYGTKVHGLRAMLGVVDVERLAYLAIFSSIAAFYGNRGQADYAVANEVLNKFAHAFKRRMPSCHTTVFDWGPIDGGMVTPPVRALFESRGVSVLPVDAAAAAFVHALTRPNDAVQMVVSQRGMAATADRRPWPAPRRISRVLRVEDNPFLRDHVINGKPVLPAACAGVWMANACQQSRPGYRFFSLSDFRVLKGVVFDEGLADRYVLEIKESELSEGSVTHAALVSSTTPEGKVRYHYSATVLLVRARPESPFTRADVRSDGQPAARSPYEDGSLFHGPTFQVITRVLRSDAKTLTVEGRHPSARRTASLGQFPAVAFDPIALDAQFQCLGLWAQRFVQAPALPTSCRRYEYFGAPPPGQPFYITAAIEHQAEHAVRASIYLHDDQGRVFAQALGAELTISPRLKRQSAPVTPAPRSDDARNVARKLRALERACYLVRTDDRIGVDHHPPAAGTGLIATIPATTPEQLGAASFRRDYRVRYAYMAGAMAKGIAAEDLVIALAKDGILGSFGAGGLTLERIEQAILRVQGALPTEPYAFNLLHSPRKVRTEDGTVDLYLKHGVKTVEASSYIDLTPCIVRYRVAGLSRRGDGAIAIGNRVIVKLSRLELAERFMQPAPAPLVEQLLQSGQITALQAVLAAEVPIADDLTVEADSGGHTDNRPLVGLLPAMLSLRDDIQRQRRYPAPIRIGAAGGIATPQSALAAFIMGADYVVTGSINQACVEAGTSTYVKQLLAQVAMTDVAMAPESDMFERGVRVQVVKQRCLFPMRAQKLFECYQRYESLEAIPEPERRQLEQQIFKDSLDNIWTQTADYLSVHKPEQLARAHDPKVKMALVFKWYMGQSSRWAAEGTPDRQLDYQIWCGPGMGAFNAWSRGTYLETPENRRVADVARVLMSEAAYCYRVNMLKMHGFGDLVSSIGVER